MTHSSALEEGQSNAHDKASPAIKERAAETFEKGVDAAQDAAVEARLQAEIAAERANDEIRKLADTGTKFVRDNPGAAVAGAVGVGILVGLALRGRD